MALMPLSRAADVRPIHLEASKPPLGSLDIGNGEQTLCLDSFAHAQGRRSQPQLLESE